MAKKPYIYESLEGWLQITKKKDWNDPSVNPQDLAPYSEFQKPYASDKDISYPEWEWTWPGDDFPPIDGITYPDPVENKCSIDEDCVWAGVIGPDEMDCGDCYTFTQAHIWFGCDVAPWWAAYGSWTVESSTEEGECYQLFTGPIMTTVCCDDSAVGSFTVTYNGPLDCVGSKEVTVGCERCCEEIGIVGSDTQAVGTTWTGVVSPACPYLECSVVSNSGCTLGCTMNDAGSLVSVSVPGDACGSFTVTVSQDASGSCDGTSVAHGVKITGDGGDWKILTTDGGGPACTNSPDCGCGCGITNHGNCYYGIYKAGSDCDFGGGDCCRLGWSQQCKGEDNCSDSNSGPPCGSTISCAAASGRCGSCTAVPPDDKGCCCSRHGWWQCEWKCTC